MAEEERVVEIKREILESENDEMRMGEIDVEVRVKTEIEEEESDEGEEDEPSSGFSHEQHGGLEDNPGGSSGQSSNANNECVTCGKTFRWPSNLKKHVAIIHAGEKQFQCRECGKEFSQRRMLKKHSLVHKKIECDECGRKLTQDEYLKEHHGRAHAPGTPYRCSHCPIQFKHGPHLKTYSAARRQHTANKPSPDYANVRTYSRLDSTNT